MEDERRIVLCVDDVSFSLITVKDRLKDHYEVYPAQSVAIMFDLLEQLWERRGRTPDVILLDLTMPDVGGFEALEMLKSDERYKDIPVIFLSAVKDRESVIKGIHLGAAAHVGKPFKDHNLIEAIEGVFSKGVQPPVHADGKSDEVRPRVLAVDDVPTMLRAVSHALSDRCKVYMLSKPAEVRDFLGKIKPDLILLDYNMPEISGFELIPIIREFPEHQETPIIFMTTEGTVENVSEAMNLGASDFIVKPFSTKDLRSKVAKYIRREWQQIMNYEL